MPVKTTTVSSDPVLVQLHELSTLLDTASSSGGGSNCSDSKPTSVSATILTYGATLTHLVVPDRRNQLQDVVLGFDHWQDYLAQAEPGALNPYFGGIIGRTASRIAHASFDLKSNYPTLSGSTSHSSAVSVSTSNGTSSTHSLKVSNGTDCHHGGTLGFDKQHWTTISTSGNSSNDDVSSDGDSTSDQDIDPYVTLQLISPHGQNGYPGRLVTQVRYQLTRRGELVIEYWAQLKGTGTDQGEGNAASQDQHVEDIMSIHSTIVSLTNHTYWNLNGVLNPAQDENQDLLVLNANNVTAKQGNSNDGEEIMIKSHCSVKNHTLWLSTSKLLELGDLHPVPTGRVLNIRQGNDQSSLLDFTAKPGFKRRLGLGLDQIPGGYGYDHVFALDSPPALSRSSPHAISEIGIQAYLPTTPHVATLVSPRTGIRLDLSTSEPALVLYTAGYLDKAMLPRTKSRSFELPSAESSATISPSVTPLPKTEHVGRDGEEAKEGKNEVEGKAQKKRRAVIQADVGKFAGVCLEPIRYPDAIHHPDWAGMVTLHHGQVYRQRSVYKFSIEKEA
ncbi:hypothetical protein EDD11_000299 [Mortierella claussenii]|nr:hypothetical protein EDD11_000299 [Mortierella claussenii]